MRWNNETDCVMNQLPPKVVSLFEATVELDNSGGRARFLDRDIN